MAERYVVVDGANQEIASSTGFEDALMLARLLPNAARVVRESDGAELSTKARRPPKDGAQFVIPVKPKRSMARPN